VFALGICAATLFKHDAFVLTTGERFEGRVVAASERALSIVRDDQRDKGAQTIDRATIQERSRFGARSVTPEYRRAAKLWWRSENLYTEGVHGFLYMPQAAMVYAPFAAMPPWLEETLWRAAGIAAYACGVWRLSRPLFGEHWASAFLIASVLAVPAALGSASNGQTNVVMGGLFALSAADLIGGRWWRVALWLMLALACKPTAIVMVLLVGAIFLRPMGWRLAVALLLFAAAPFLHPAPQFVLGQYVACQEKMLSAATPPDLFQDIRGMLVSFGIDVPGRALTIVRAAAAVVTLGLCLLASRRFADHARAMMLLTLGACYLMVFNPRTEGLSYVILGAPAALWATRELLDRRWPAAAFCVTLCLAFQFSTQMALNHKNYWVRPLGTCVLAGLVIAEIVRGRSRWEGRV
jgi:hypothetical protein